MSFDISVTREPQRTRVVLRGPATLGRLLSVLQVLQVDSRTWPADAVLLDLSGIETLFAPWERSQVQEEAVQRLGLQRVVTVRWNGA